MDQSSDFVSMLVKKLAPPLVTLLSAEPEIQYVALRNINLVVQKRFLDHLQYIYISAARLYSDFELDLPYCVKYELFFAIACQFLSCAGLTYFYITVMP